MSWHFCTSGAAVAKAGLHCSSNSGSAVTMAEWSDEAEGYIMTYCNTDFSGSYATLNSGIKGALADVTSSKIAEHLIADNPTGYLTREADMLMNLNYDIVFNGLKFLNGKSKDLKTA